MLNFRLKLHNTAIAIVIAVVVILTFLTGVGRLNEIYLKAASLFGFKNAKRGVGTVVFCDCGQSDCIIILSGGKAAMIDFGDEQHAVDIANALEDYGVDELDACVLTHPHADRYGGLGVLLDRVKINRLILDGATVAEQHDVVLDRFLQKARDGGVEMSEPADFTLGEFEFSLVYVNPSADSVDDRSLVYAAQCKFSRFLFMGDLSSKEEGNISKEAASCNVLKVARSGGSSATAESFLRAAHPDIAVICCASGNSRKHPDAETVGRLKNIDAKVYRTSAGFVEVDAVTLNVKTVIRTRRG